MCLTTGAESEHGVTYISSTNAQELFQLESLWLYTQAQSQHSTWVCKEVPKPREWLYLLQRGKHTVFIAQIHQKGRGENEHRQNGRKITTTHTTFSAHWRLHWHTTVLCMYMARAAVWPGGSWGLEAQGGSSYNTVMGLLQSFNTYPPPPQNNLVIQGTFASWIFRHYQ